MDDSGYTLKISDLQFLAMSSEQLEWWQTRQAPLGLSPGQYGVFRQRLNAALEADGFDPDRCDVRIQGSSARFWAGAHKRLPTTRPQIANEFFLVRGRLPEEFEVDEIERRLTTAWPSGGGRPAARPFDALKRLGVDRFVSDIDVQLSSSEIVDRCAALLDARGLGLEHLTLEHPHYAFVQKHLVDEACPNLVLFRTRMTDVLDRWVSTAVFPSGGPTRSTDDRLSTHFRSEDWIIHEATAEVDAT